MLTIRTILILTLFILVNGMLVSAQDQDTWRTILDEPDSEEKAEKLLKIGLEIEETSYDSAKVIYKELAAVSERIDYLDGYFKYVYNYSYIIAEEGDLEGSINLNTEAMKKAIKANRLDRVAKIKISLGNAYTYNHQFKEAITSYNDALSYHIENNDTANIAHAYNCLAFAYNNMGNAITKDSLLAIKSIDYRRKAAHLAYLRKDSLGLLYAFKGIATTFSNLEMYDSSQIYYEKAMDLAEELGDNRQLAVLMSRLSRTLYYNDKVDEAYDLLLKATPIIEEMGTPYMILNTKRSLGGIYEARGDHEKAIIVIQQAIDYAKSYGINNELEQLYYNLSHNAAMIYDFETAYYSYHKATEITDSLMGLEIKKEVLDLQSKYETAQKDNKILELSLTQTKKNRLIIGLALLSAFIALLSFYYIKRYQYKSKIVEQEKEKLEQKGKLKVSSSIIESQENERRRIAQDLHDGLGGILSSVKYSLSEVDENYMIDKNGMETFSNALKQLDLAISEMRKVAHNMMPESLVKFGLDDAINDVSSSISQSAPINIHYSSYGYIKQKQPIEITLYRIVQESLNNALKHSNATDVYVQLNYEDGIITLSIEDNGKGMNTEKENIDGMGLQSIKNRVAYLNGKIDISSEIGNGTIIVIELESDDYENL